MHPSCFFSVVFYAFPIYYMRVLVFGTYIRWKKYTEYMRLSGVEMIVFPAFVHPLIRLTLMSVIL